MKKTGIFYGSTTGTTESVARQIAGVLGVASADVHDVATLTAEQADPYEVLILGTSTWGDGELQEDWYDGLRVLKGMDLTDKVVALFGCGDSCCYADTFCDGMGILYQELKDTGCRFCGSTDASDYEFGASQAAEDGCFVGLAIDGMNESDKTDSRIAGWAAVLKKECLDS